MLGQVRCVGQWTDESSLPQDRWHQEGQEYIDWYLRHEQRERCPLFAHLLPHIVKEMGLEDRYGDEGLAGEVWDSLREAWRTKLPKIGLCRWFALADALPKLVGVWSRRYLATVVNCVRSGLARSRAVQAALRKVAVEQSTAAASSSSSVVRPDEPKGPTKSEPPALRALRSAAQNQLELNLMVLGDFGARDIASGVCSLLRPYRQAHSESNLLCRSPAESFEYYRRQAQGECMKPLVDSLGLLQSRGFWDEVGVSSLGDRPAHCRGATRLTAEHPSVLLQDTVVRRLSHVALALVFRNMMEVFFFLFSCNNVIEQKHVYQSKRTKNGGGLALLVVAGFVSVAGGCRHRHATHGPHAVLVAVVRQPSQTPSGGVLEPHAAALCLVGHLCREGHCGVSRGQVPVQCTRRASRL